MHTTRYLPTYCEDARRHHFFFVVRGSIVFLHAACNLGKIVLSCFYIEMRREQITILYLSSNTKRAQLAWLEIKSGFIWITKQKQNKFLPSFIHNVHYFIQWLLSLKCWLSKITTKSWDNTTKVGYHPKCWLLEESCRNHTDSYVKTFLSEKCWLSKITTFFGITNFCGVIM